MNGDYLKKESEIFLYTYPLLFSSWINEKEEELTGQDRVVVGLFRKKMDIKMIIYGHLLHQYYMNAYVYDTERTETMMMLYECVSKLEKSNRVLRDKRSHISDRSIYLLAIAHILSEKINNVSGFDENLYIELYFQYDLRKVLDKIANREISLEKYCK